MPIKVSVSLLQMMTEKIYLFIILKFKAAVDIRASMMGKRWNLKLAKARKGRVLIRLYLSSSLLVLDRSRFVRHFVGTPLFARLVPTT